MAEEVGVTQQKRTKKLIAWSVAIFLGALGSGVWEWFLKDALNVCGRALLQFLKFFFSAQSLYKNIGKGDFDYFGLIPFVLITVILILLPALGAWRSYRSINELKNIITGGEKQYKERIINRSEWMIKNRNLIVGLSALNAIFSLLIYSSLTYEAIHRKTAVTWVERSIEILAPYVGLKETVMLRSEYRAVADADKFYALENHIKEKAKKAKIQLPEFNSIR